MQESQDSRHPTGAARVGYSGGGLQERIGHWTRALQVNDVRPGAAGLLYAGDHWKVIQDLEAQRRDHPIKVWIASAGYGLIAFDEPIKPYSATFVHPHRESVTPDPRAYSAADWWSALSDWSPTSGRPRRISDLGRQVSNEGGFLLLALSEPYALALENDIHQASQVLGDQLGLICVGLSGKSAQAVRYGSYIGDALLPAEARLKANSGLRGAMQGLNARLAAKVVAGAANWYPSARRLRALMEEWLQTTPQLVYANNRRMSDRDVMDYICQRIKAGGATSRTRLLADLRASGLACEQSRFAGLYQKVSSPHAANGQP